MLGGGITLEGVRGADRFIVVCAVLLDGLATTMVQIYGSPRTKTSCCFRLNPMTMVARAVLNQW